MHISPPPCAPSFEMAARARGSFASPAPPLTNQFPVPALACAQFGADGKISSITPALAHARSPGSWSDILRVSANLMSKPLVVSQVQFAETSAQFDLRLASPQDITRGDLLRITFDDKYVLLCGITNIELPAPTSPPEPNVARVTCERMVWLQQVTADLPLAQDGTVEMFTTTPPRMLAATVSNTDSSPLGEPEPFALNLQCALSDAPALGSLVRANLGGELWMLVRSLRAHDDQMSPPDASPLGERVQITGDAWLRIENAPVIASNATANAEALTFELWAKQSESNFAHLAELGFHPAHPRNWATLPTDDDLFPDPNAPPAMEIPALWREAAHPRFPLAGTVDENVLYFPIGMTALPEFFLAANPIPLTALERDGLQNFDAALFLDPRLPKPAR